MRSPREPHLLFPVKAPCKQHSSVTHRPGVCVGALWDYGSSYTCSALTMYHVLCGLLGAYRACPRPALTIVSGRMDLGFLWAAPCVSMWPP